MASSTAPKPPPRHRSPASDKLRRSPHPCCGCAALEQVSSSASPFSSTAATPPSDKLSPTARPRDGLDSTPTVTANADHHQRQERTIHIQPKPSTVKNPPEQFTGDVWFDVIASPQYEDQRMVVGLVRFAPGARTAWHSHVKGQTLNVTHGIARMQARGGDIIEVQPGQTVYTPPGERNTDDRSTPTSRWRPPRNRRHRPETGRADRRRAL